MLFKQIFKGLNEKDVKYLIVGGIAVNFHGFERATSDLDIMISLEKDNIERFVIAVENLKFVPRLPVSIIDFANPDKRKIWIEEKNMKVFTIYNPLNELESVDILIENFLDFDEAYKNREILEAEDVKIPVISIDYLIKLKKVAGRSRDMIDIKALKKIKEIKNEKDK
jgi:hypothetical protein